MKKMVLCAMVWAMASGLFAQYTANVPKWERFVRVTGTNVNLRMSPGLDGEKMTVRGAGGESKAFFYEKGTVLPVLDETAEWVKVYCMESATRYVWLNKRYAQGVKPDELPKGYEHFSMLKHGYRMLTYNFEGTLQNYCFDWNYPFETEKIETPALNVYANQEERYLSADGSRDWKRLMPEIVKSFPASCVSSWAKGEALGDIRTDFRNPGKNSVEEASYNQNLYHYSAYWGEARYVIDLMACPVREKDEVLVIAMSHSGQDDMDVDMIRTVRYDIKKKEFSEVSRNIPGIVTGELGLSYEFLDKMGLSELKERIKADPLRDIDVSSCQGVPMVYVSAGNVDNRFALYDTADEGVMERTTVYYLWDGETFVKMMGNPYVEVAEKQADAYYEEYIAQRNDPAYPQNHNERIHLTSYFYETLARADELAKKTGEKWKEMDIWSFGEPEARFTTATAECLHASSTANVRIEIFPEKENGETDRENSQTIILQMIYNSETYKYEIRDFVSEDGKVSVFRMANDFIKKNS